MKRAVLSALALGAIVPGHAQEADPARVDAIWNAVAARIERQNDQWFKDGEFPRIVQSLKFELEIFPEDYDIVTNLGWMLENIEEWSDALAIYVRYRRLRPNDPEAVYPEAEFYYKRKAYEKVPPLLEPSLKFEEKPHANTYRVLAHAYERMNLFADAVRVWKLFLKVQPNDGPAQVNLKKVEAKMRGEKPR